MDFLSKPLAQLKELFLSMTPAARVTTGLLLVVVVVSLGYLFAEQKANSDCYLFGGEPFPAGELQAMETAIAQAGLSGYELEGARIRVPRGQRHAYIAALAEGDALPHNFGDILVEAVTGGGFAQSSEHRRQALELALERELALSIGEMEGIERAAVFYDEEMKGGLRREKSATALVTLRPVGAKPLDVELAGNIRRMVAAAFAGLDADKVTVMDNGTGRTIVGDPENPSSPTEERDIARQSFYEQHLEDDIRALLSHISGLKVEARVVLSDKRWHQEESIEHKPQTVQLQVTDSQRTRTVEGGTPGGRVGAEAQAMTARSLSPTQFPGPNEEETQSETRTVNAISSTLTKREDVGLTIKRASAVVAVPSSFFKTVWHERNPPDPTAAADAEPKEPDPAELDQIRREELTNIQAQVAMLLPDAEGVQDKTELVNVSVYQDVTPPPMPGPGVTDKALSWLARYWSTLGMIALVVFSLFVLRSMVRATQSVESDVSMVLPPLAETSADDDEAGPNPAERRLRHFQRGGASLQEELSELVNDDPDAAANILRTWIGSSTS